MNSLKILASSAAIVLAVNFGAQAQMMADMSKVSCAQLLSGNANAVEAAIWLSGYYNGLRKNTMLDLNQFKKNAEAVIAACGTNPNKTVMQTVNAMLSPGKKK